MLATSKLVAFLATTQPETSRRFYEGILGLRFVADEPVALVFDANGSILRISKVQNLMPAPFTVLGWVVTNVSFEAASLASKGVIFERYEILSQDDQGVCTLPDGAKVAWFKDPDGNLLSITQH